MSWKNGGEAKGCAVKDDCSYGESVYKGDEFLGEILAGCVNKDKLTSSKDIPEGTECVCISGRCDSVA